VTLSPGKRKVTLSMNEDVLALLDQHTTPRKRAEKIEELIKKEYGQPTTPNPKPPETPPQQPTVPKEEQEDYSSEISVASVQKQ